jgi:predicted protein tyrosine phosphatase/membrane-associated phospholipid phosphatase
MKIFWKAAVASASLSGLFILVYTSCNWITSRRQHVRSCFFAWERSIPFVPALILPYMSIDLFFIAAPFLARSGRELRTLTWRIALAILVAGACFLAMPLKFAFARPHVDGPLGLIFNNFRSLDLPYNQCPSLHVALWAILVDIYLRRSHGLLRWLAAGWFILMALSPLLTYQHHVVDILGGLALAAVCFHFVADQPLRRPFLPNRRVGTYYAGGTIILFAVAGALFPWGLVLIWPAFSLALVAAGYLFLGPGIFRKERGRHPWTTWVLLGPVLLGQRISLIYYSRRCRPYDQLTDRLWIGRRLTTAEAMRARAAGVTAVIDLTAEFAEVRPFRELTCLHLSILDLTAPTACQIERALAFIEQHAGLGIVYVHCKVGYSRTAAVAGAYLLATGHAQSVAQAVSQLRRTRPSLIARPEAIAALDAFQVRERHPAGTSPQSQGNAMRQTGRE